MQVRAIAFYASIADTCTSFATSLALSRKCCAACGHQISNSSVFCHEKNIASAHLTRVIGNSSVGVVMQQALGTSLVD
jgi:hypothetical protein